RKQGKGVSRKDLAYVGTFVQVVALPHIFPAEIEDVLRRHPSVADVAVIGVPHERWGETVCAVIEPHVGAVVDEQEIVAYCAERLAGYKKPTTVRVVDELPRTVSGKAQKFLLRERFGETTVSAPAVPAGRRGDSD
ncbi:MAG: long-chain fatty acid--CoA ligase, partial [Solirubrobacterales bacterium]|nr:long-chain fatty acid--CoA ligase [Solirubrobacterales bacterium]